MTRPKPRYQPGDRIGGRYQVHKALMGGMGEVYLCLDLEQNYPYALKTFQQRYQSTVLRQAFEQEVATWVALEKHPNIVRCFYMDILDNQPFMVLEWIAGEEGKGADLRGWLRHGPLDLKMALEITLDVVRGLIHAQEKQPGLVHRDLKPENILVAQGGLAKITDFGLAQIVQTVGLEIEGEADGRQSMVGKGGIAGTPAYMAPEQWRGEPLDERTDIYAVGCILYEMLTGQWPFRVDFTPTTPQQWKQWLSAMQSNHENNDVPQLSVNLPVSVTDLLQGCLAKTLAERSENLAALLISLAALYRHQFGSPSPTLVAAGEMTATEYNNRGLTYKNLKQHNKALEDFNQAIELDPQSPAPYSNRGLTYAALQQYEAALADYNQALKIDPNFSVAYTNRGIMYKNLQQYEAALTNYNRAIELDPNDAYAYSNRGLAYATLQQFKAALTDYNQAIELDPNLTWVYSNRGIVYKKLQQYEAALADYNRAIELDPNDAYAYSCRGSLYDDLKQYEAALIDYGRAIELDPKDAQTFFNRASLYDDLKQYKAALTDYGQAIELDPYDTHAYTNRGFIYATLQQYEAALTDYGRAIELDPNNTNAYFNRAMIYNDLKQYEAALIDYQQVLKIDPSDAPVYFNLGVLFVKTDRLRESLFYFEKAAQLDYPRATQAIAEVKQMLGHKIEPQPNPSQAAFDAFQQAGSIIAMQQIIANFPFITQPNFIATIEQAIAQQVPPEDQPYFEQRLVWLKQIAQEKNQ